jgi:hypothetical protein
MWSGKIPEEVMLELKFKVGVGSSVEIPRNIAIQAWGTTSEEL